MSHTENLIDKLNKFGIIQAIKEGVVFTLLITGKGLSKANTQFDILRIVTGELKDIYPNIEVLKTEDEFILIVLKKLDQA